MTKSKVNEAFGQILLEAIDDALLSLGESVNVSLYFHIENRFRIKRLEIPGHIGDFSDALDKIFGLGARNLEILFMKSLNAKLSKFGVAPEWSYPTVTFHDYVHLMEQTFERAEFAEEKIEVFMYGGEKQEARLR